MRALKRALRRADAPIAYSEGFNPRPKISMGPALPLGYESLCELADITLTRMFAPKKLRQKLVPAMPAGLGLLETERVTPRLPKLSNALSVCYVVKLAEAQMFREVDALLRRFNEKDAAPLERVRQNKKRVVDVKQFVLDAAIVSGERSRTLNLEISMGERGTCSPSEAARAIFDITEEDARLLRITRTKIKFDGG
jgi:radical SAM-linked protein